MEQRAAERRVDNVCHGECGWPVAGLLAEPFKDRVHGEITWLLRAERHFPPDRGAASDRVYCGVPMGACCRMCTESLSFSRQ